MKLMFYRHGWEVCLDKAISGQKCLKNAKFKKTSFCKGKVPLLMKTNEEGIEGFFFQLTMDGNPPRKRSRAGEERLVTQAEAAREQKHLSPQDTPAVLAFKMAKRIIFAFATDQQVLTTVQDIVGDQGFIQSTDDLTSLEDPQDIACVVLTSHDIQVAEQVKDWCENHCCNFIWAQAFNDYLSLNSFPTQKLLESFKGQNSRPDNDLLVTEELCQAESGSWKITSTKKHHLMPNDRISIDINGKTLQTKVSRVISEKAFEIDILKDDISASVCDTKSYVIKLLRRYQSQYTWSKKHKTFTKLDENCLLKDIKLKLLACIIGCEIVSSILQSSRLPTQDILVNIKHDAKDAKSSPLSSFDKIIILGNGIFADSASEFLQDLSSISRLVDNVQDLELNLKGVAKESTLVLSCGGSYESRSQAAELCKKHSIKYIDSGLAYKQGHIETLFPGQSALFHSIVDYEDVSDEAPHCVTKSFPTNIDHCLQWAVRKLASWSKDKPDENEDFLAKAKSKFTQHFIDKPRKLMQTFPPDNTETWKKPRRKPKIDIELSMNNPLHSDLVQGLVELYSSQEASDELQDKLLLSLIKMRAFTYDIENFETDIELLQRAKKIKHCQPSMAKLAAAFIRFEVEKCLNGYKCSDWWITDAMDLEILQSKSQIQNVQVGKVSLNPWENLSIGVQDHWTIQDLIEHLLKEVELTVELITQNGKAIYIKAMPTHVKKKDKLINSLVKFDENTALIHVGVAEVEDLVTVQISSS